jgi:hypothetical protein
MTLPLDDDIAIELPTETNMPARQQQKRGVACYWLPSGKCMISPPNMTDAIAIELPIESNMPARQQQKRGVACYWLPSGKCMISPPNRTASTYLVGE